MPAVPPVPEGVVAVEDPEAPMPEVVPELDVPPDLGLAVDEDDGDMVPLAAPPAAPMPEAVPEAEPDMLGPDPQAAKALAKATANISFFIGNSLS